MGTEKKGTAVVHGGSSVMTLASPAANGTASLVFIDDVTDAPK